MFLKLSWGLSEIAPELIEDRKSTRLNSSHGYISYAVFCLKTNRKQAWRRSRLQGSCRVVARTSNGVEDARRGSGAAGRHHGRVDGSASASAGPGAPLHRLY